MVQPQDCPGNDYWQSVRDGTVAAEQQEHCERHFSTCPACQARMDAAVIQEDALLQLGRQYGDPTESPSDPTLLQVLEQLSEITASGCGPRLEAMDLYFLKTSDRPDLLGLLGAYEVQEVIGQGGMGIVLKAYDPALNRQVAIKVLAPALASSATARRRFTREAQAAAAVRHEHIVPVYGVHEIDGLPYLVMQYIPGESLQDRLDWLGPLDLSDILHIGYQAACGLAAAHAQGLIHRDIKPANILIVDSEAGDLSIQDASACLSALPIAHCSRLTIKITDFGLARTVDDVGLTQSGVVAGTPQYMAPEQARGEPVDHRADLFSLGGVLYAMCTGVSPFCGDNAVALLRQVSEREPAPIRTLNPEVPPWLALLIDRLLAKKPPERLQSAAEVAELLHGYLAHLRQPNVPPPVLPAPGTAPPWQGDTQMFVFSCSACGMKVKAQPGRAGKPVKCPHCDQTIRVPDSKPAKPGNARLIQLSLFVACVLVLVLVSVRVFRPDKAKVEETAAPSFMEMILGHRTVAGVENTGFYNDEENDSGPFRWTDGKARLTIPLTKDDHPRSLFLHLQRPQNTWLRITVNDRELVNEPAADVWIQKWERTLDLSALELRDRLVVDILSNTFAPPGDPRALGVKVRVVKLQREPSTDKIVVPPASLLDVPLGYKQVPGVEDAGFHEVEDFRGVVFRWTKGTGKLVIPLDLKERPKALLVQLGWPPNRSLRISANDRELFHGESPAPTFSRWEQVFDLSGIDLGEKLVLELVSNTQPLLFSPSGPQDPRILGIQVRGIKLLR
jgi:serine/threonine protein kinase